MPLLQTYSGIAPLGFRERSGGSESSQRWPDSQRNSSENDSSERHSLRLSSKLKVNARRKEQPSGLLLSEQLRVQCLGWNQRIVDTESNVSLVQTVEAALDSIKKHLQSMQRLEAGLDPSSEEYSVRQQTQTELEQLLESIDSVARSTCYDTESLLDGSHEVQGLVTGEHLEFVGATANTATSPVSGYPVKIFSSATRSLLVGAIPLTESMIDAGEQITLIEGKRALRFKSIRGEGIQGAVKRLNREIQNAGLSLNASLERGNYLSIQHQHYGSKQSFLAASHTVNLLSPRSGQAVMATPGKNVQGSINNEVCVGDGQFLTASEDSAQIAGLSIRYTGTEADLKYSGTGNVSIFQNALSFRVEMLTQQSMRLNVRSMKTNTLGRGIPNASGYESLSDVSVFTPQQSKDTRVIIKKALTEVLLNRKKLQSFHENTLKRNLKQLRTSHEQLLPLRSVILDMENAQKVLKSTRTQMMEHAFLPNLVQKRQTPQSVMSLLG